MRVGVTSTHGAVWSSWASLASLAAIVGIVNAGVLEIDLLFPRNETYTPTPFMPVIFGVRNAPLAQHLQPTISVRIQNASDLGARGETYERRVARSNATMLSSAETYFEYSFIHDTFATEGPWRIIWDVTYRSCLEDEDGNHRGATTYNETTGRPTTRLAQKSKEWPLAIDVTGAIVKATDPVGNPGTPDLYTCAVVAATTPTPVPSPCLVKIDSAAAASISTSLWLQRCNNWLESDDPDDCPPGSPFGPPANAAPELAIVGVAGLTIAIGALGFFLLDELVRGSVRTWLSQGKRNLGVPASPDDASTVSDLLDGDLTTPGFIRLAVCGHARARQSWETTKRGSSVGYPCDIPPGINRCGHSTFEDRTSDVSPLASDCLQIIRNIEGDSRTQFEAGIVEQEAIAESGSCRFGVEATKVNGNGGFYVGGQDVIDIINEVVKNYRRSNGRVGARGTMSCDGNIKGQSVLWGIY